MHTLSASSNGRAQIAVRLSYKFQRLREQLRSAIDTGEFRGRLPGERELGKRYRANAKTINKALCDLASEGLLVRHIGRGTFVSNGRCETGNHVRPRSFVCLQSGHEPPGGHRANLLQRVSEALRREGHELEFGAPVGENGTNSHTGNGRAPLWHAADGVVSFPMDPLSGGSAGLSDSQLSDILRRQLPIVLIGAAGESAKVNAVLPDYTDAGYRLSEHLFQSGYDVVNVITTAVGHRATELVLAGARTAAQRYQRVVRQVSLPADGRDVADVIGPIDASGRGIVCVGARALHTALQSRVLRDQRQNGQVALATILEPGDPSARSAGVTSYEVSPDKIAAWAAKLLMDSRPAHRPLEIHVPGVVQIIAAAAAPSGVPHGRSLCGELAEVSI